ncbi:hypothetical protein FOTG_10047 [Fusarium oxysporum f. sp. vasinfectum 25433]|uniref:Uncharacterized protein n=1 Tax=Fusarium oxysporum f. sp. vasinfectum 25433 TaxID=1089449 RepID=X0MPI3_FUSOX|nr:hypothetical protein FOTG_10047 [Fusarium oxysporum f. sp. vasinfectum 25433]
MLKVSSVRPYNEVKSMPLTLGAYLTDSDCGSDSGLDNYSSHSDFYILSRSTTRSLSPASSGTHTATETITETTTKIITVTTTSPVAGPSTATAQSEVNELDYDDARAIYRRYKADREAWYATQPRGALKTNQQYRKAMKLPQRYTKAKYNWCLDYKEMGPQCRIGRSVRDWTKEEMMAYLDFDEAENERVNKQVEEELKARRFTTYRGPDYVWKAAARDYEDQQRVHRTRNRRI